MSLGMLFMGVWIDFQLNSNIISVSRIVSHNEWEIIILY